MGRPIKQIFIGNRSPGGVGGDGLNNVTLGGTNNSTGYANGDALTIGAPDLNGGVQAVGEVTVYAVDGALVEGITTLAPSGTGIDGLGGGADVYPGVDATGDTAGTGAIVTITKANTNGVVDYSDVTVEITTEGSGYAVAETITVPGTVFAGGASPANDLTLTIGTFVTDGTVNDTTITVAGSGYTSAPTVSAGTGTQGTLTLTGVLTTGGPPSIASTAFILGGSNQTADIEAQKGSRRYRVTTADGTQECTLVAATPSVAGEMAIVATDSAAGTYWVTKLTNNTVRVSQNTGTQFADGSKVKWGDTAILNDTVKITF